MNAPSHSLHSNADTLSRLPLPDAPAEVPMEPELVLLLQHLHESPVTASDICKWTKHDPLLSRSSVCRARLATQM